MMKKPITQNEDRRERNYLITYLVLVFTLSTFFYIPLIGSDSMDGNDLLVLGLTKTSTGS